MKCRLPIRIGGGGGSAAPTPVSVTITGTGNTTYCYAAIGGTNRYGAGTYEVMPGDKITFGVYGRSSSYYGRVTIDGQQVLNVTNQTTQTYEWTVPDDISAISMQMSYTSSSYTRNGRIVVTTTKKPTGGGSGGGTTPSEYAVAVIEGSNLPAPMNLYLQGIMAITVDGVNITEPGTYSAANGGTLSISVLQNSVWRVDLNGTTVLVKDGEMGTYTHTIKSAVNLKFDMPDMVMVFSITTE